jgi:DeoR/GlpR family transcriptional regulator of sugar metabolism
MMTGGRVRYDSNSVAGRMVETTLSNMRFDTVYLGTDSIDPSLGLSTFNEAEAHQNVAMMDASSRVVVLADSSKFRAPALHRFCAINRIAAIVTDTGLPPEHAEQITAQGVSLLLANPGEGAA